MVMNIYEKLITLKAEVGGFSKDAAGYKYKYVSGSQVLGEIKDILERLKLLVYPQELKHTHFEKVDGTKDFIVYGDIKYVIVNAEKPEEKIVVDWLYYGQQDEVSKAFGSGLTYAERYFFLKFLGLPTDDEDPDIRQNPKPKQVEQKPIPPKPNTKSRSAQLVALVKGSSYTTEDVLRAILALGAKKADDLTQEQFDKLYSEIKEAVKHEPN